MVGTSIDPHIDRVLGCLPSAVNVVRLDVDQFPRRQSLTIEQSGVHTSIGLDETPLQGDDLPLPLVWFRRLAAPGTSEPLDQRFRRFTIAESNHVLESVLTLLKPTTWIDEYWACRRASLKPVQQQAAAGVGFAIADSHVSNAPRAAGAWLKHRPHVVSKTMSSPVVFDDGEERGFSFTRVLDDVDRKELQPVAVAPTQFQELVEPSFELRVTSVGVRHFAVRLDSDKVSSQGIRDWRSERLATSYSWFELPPHIGHRLTLLLGRLGLDYAASDFIVTGSDEYYYLESNPHGAWIWLEDELDEWRISHAFADHVLKKLPLRE